MKMKAHTTFVTALLLAGCAVMDTRDSPPPGHVQCTRGGSDICVIEVTVNSCTSIVARPNDVWVPPNDSGDVMWRINNPGQWKFTGNGITFRNPHQDFSNPRGGGSVVFRWNNAHSVKNKSHKYNINVTDGRQTCSHDPTVMN